MGLIMVIKIHALEVELPRVVGKPEVFVLSSCGTGIPVYRKLQKAGIPFAAGTYIRANATISSQDCSHPRSSVKNHTSQYPARPTEKH